MNVSANRKDVFVLVWLDDLKKLVRVLLHPQLFETLVVIVAEVYVSLRHKVLVRVVCEYLLQPVKHQGRAISLLHKVVIERIHTVQSNQHDFT